MLNTILLFFYSKFKLVVYLSNNGLNFLFTTLSKDYSRTLICFFKEKQALNLLMTQWALRKLFILFFQTALDLNTTIVAYPMSFSSAWALHDLLFTSLFAPYTIATPNMRRQSLAKSALKLEVLQKENIVLTKGLLIITVPDFILLSICSHFYLEICLFVCRTITLLIAFFRA